jgi:hypothetical protein
MLRKTVVSNMGKALKGLARNVSTCYPRKCSNVGCAMVLTGGFIEMLSITPQCTEDNIHTQWIVSERLKKVSFNLDFRN